jgi:hypothetical protein
MRNRVIGAGAAVLAFALAAGCNEQALSPGIQPDVTPPSVSVLTPGDTTDLATGVQFQVDASDNLGLKAVSILLEGGLDGQVDTVFTGQVLTFSQSIQILLPEGTAAGGWIIITASASDGNNNGNFDKDSVFLKNEDALIVEILNPSNAAVTSPGKDIPIVIHAAQKDGVKRVGYLLEGVITGGDSIGDLRPMPADTILADTVTISASAPEGTFTVTGFAVDSADRRRLTSPVTVSIQLAINDTDPPAITVTVAQRVEVDDSIIVRATDPSGIIEVGWQAFDLAGIQVGGDSVTLAGNLTDVIEFWDLGFSFSELPQAVVIIGFAEDSNGNRATTANTASPERPVGSVWTRAWAKTGRGDAGGGR